MSADWKLIDLRRNEVVMEGKSIDASQPHTNIHSYNEADERWEVAKIEGNTLTIKKVWSGALVDIEFNEDEGIDNFEEGMFLDVDFSFKNRERGEV